MQFLVNFCNGGLIKAMTSSIFFRAAEKVKSYLHKIALSNFSIICFLLQNKLRNDTAPTFVYLFFDVGTTTRRPGCSVGNKIMLTQFRGSSQVYHPCYTRGPFRESKSPLRIKE